MHKFVDTLGELDSSNSLSHLNFSYYSSRTMQTEIEKYSKPDMTYVIWFLVFFWLSLSFAMWFNMSSSSSRHRGDSDVDDEREGNGRRADCHKPTMMRHNRYSASDNDEPRATPSLKANASLCCITRFWSRLSCFSIKMRLLSCFASCCARLARVTCLEPDSVCINGASFLPVCMLVQFVLTIVATFGLVSLVNIETNPMTFTLVLIVLSKFIFFSNLDTLLSNMFIFFS